MRGSPKECRSAIAFFTEREHAKGRVHMMKKETMRFYIAIILSVIAVVSSVTAISCGISVILQSHRAEMTFFRVVNSLHLP